MPSRPGHSTIRNNNGAARSTAGMNPSSGGNEGVGKKKDLPPLKRASFLSRLFFNWVTSLMNTGFYKPLEISDLWELNTPEKADVIGKQIIDNWNRELRHERPHITRALLLALWPRLFGQISILFFFSLAFVTIPGVILPRILDWLQSDGNIGVGIALAVAFLGLLLLNALGIHQYFASSVRTGLRAKAAMTVAVYNHLMRVPGGSGVAGEALNIISNDAQRVFEAFTYGQFIWLGPVILVELFILLMVNVGWPAIPGTIIILLFFPIQSLIARWVSKARHTTIGITDERVRIMSEILSAIKLVKLYGWERPFMRLVNQVRRKEQKWLWVSLFLKTLNRLLSNVTSVAVTFITLVVYAFAAGNTLTADVVFPTLALFNAFRFPLTMLALATKGLAEARVAAKRMQNFLMVDPVAGWDGAVEPQWEEDRVDGEDDASSSSYYKGKAGDGEGRVVLRVEDGEFRWDAPPTTMAHGSSAADDDDGGGGGGGGDSDALAGEEHQALLAHEGGSDGGGGSTDASPHGYGRAYSTLRNINFSVRKGELVAVVGGVGSGKSSLLAAVLKEIGRVSGCVGTRGRVAYCPQEPWVFNALLRENILFGQTMDADRYARTIQTCQLESDLEQLPAYDMTEIGERGINLSGGQKARVGLARAVYSGADIYLLDDPLSAVDQHVGNALFHRCIREHLRDDGKAVVLVTHQLQYLPHCDRVVLMEDGEILEEGTYADLMAMGGAFFELIDNNTTKEEEGEAESASLSSADDPTLNNYDLGETMLDLDLHASHGHVPRATRVQREKEERERTKEAVAALARLRRLKTVLRLPLGVATAQEGLRRGGADAYAEPSSDDEWTEDVEARAADVALQPHDGVDGQDHTSTPPVDEEEVKRRAAGALVVKEDRATGGIRPAVVARYAMAGPLWPILFPLLVFVFLGAQAVQVVIDFWISLWVRDGLSAPSLAYAGAYAGLVALYALACLVREGLFTVFSMGCASTTHNRCFQAVLYAPMRFFDNTPTGRILNRFSKDQDTLDDALPDFSSMLFVFSLIILSTFVVVVLVLPWLLVVLLPIMVGFFLLAKYYRASSRELKRLVGITISPMFNHFNSTIRGLTSIRAYELTDDFVDRNFTNVDRNNRAFWAILMAGRWLGLRLDLMSVAIIFSTCIFAVGFRSNPALAGLALAYALQISGLFQWTTRVFVETETNMTSVERLQHYAYHLPREGHQVISRLLNEQRSNAHIGPSSREMRNEDEGDEDEDEDDVRTLRILSTIAEKLQMVFEKWITKGDDWLMKRSRRYLKMRSAQLQPPPPSSWPIAGEVHFDNVSIRYAEGLPLVVKGLSAHVLPGESIGIVGRTGSGKSTLVSSIFRLLELAEGTISIDGVPIDHLRLQHLRAGLFIIPQDPVMFEGTVRRNLDPFEVYTDEEVWDALKKVNLKDFVDALPGKLLSPVKDGGSNFSLGQRQLVCISRAILRMPKVLVLDEATAAVDLETDTLIQKTLRKEFAECTVLTIAHRLHTIIDSDRIMVLEAGELAEFDSPSRLLDDPHSRLSAFVDDTGPATAKHLRAVARGEESIFDLMTDSISEAPALGADALYGSLESSGSVNTADAMEEIISDEALSSVSDPSDDRHQSNEARGGEDDGVGVQPQPGGRLAFLKHPRAVWNFKEPLTFKI